MCMFVYVVCVWRMCVCLFVYGLYVCMFVRVWCVLVCKYGDLNTRKTDILFSQSALLQIETFKHSCKIYVIKHSTKQMFIIWCL